MGHITGKSFIRLQQRLDKPPQGAPESEALFKILEHIFTEKQAELLSVLPINFFSLKKAASIWKVDEKKAKEYLMELAGKGIVVDFEDKFVVTPTMAGFFEFTIMKMHGKFDKQLLSELYYQYLNNEDEFGKRVFALNPCIARTFVHEDTIQEKDMDIVMDYEKATQVIEKNDFWAITTCYCRHKMEHLGKACDMPQDVCMAFGDTARSLVKHGFAHSVTKEKAHEVLQRCIKLGLVQIGSNMQNDISWICNCCGCCCEALLAYKKLGYNPRIHSNWYADNTKEICTACGICVKKCPVNAISIIKEGVENPKAYAVVDKERCIGCGVCTRFCPTKSLKIERRPETNFTPMDTFERIILQAIDSNTLQNLILDNYHLWHYGVLRQFLKIIFMLPPAKWILANKQLRSRCIQAVGNYYYNKEPQTFGNIKPDYSHPEMKKKYKEE